MFYDIIQCICAANNQIITKHDNMFVNCQFIIIYHYY